MTTKIERNPWTDPNVIAALREGRHASDIALIECPECGIWGYYNEGSHFTCRNPDCDESFSGEELDRIIDNGDVMTLDDWDGFEPEQIP